MKVWIEPSGENPALASAEAAAIASALGGRSQGTIETPEMGLLELDLPDATAARMIAERMALARRVLVPWDPDDEGALLAHLRREGQSGRSMCLRPLGRPTGSRAPRSVERFARAYVDGGGRVDLETPERRFWLADGPPGHVALAEEVGAIDRGALEDRRMPQLPFRRPVSLSPKLGRAAVNLSRALPGGHIVDPFVGTGALMLEAALMGIRVSGGDLDPGMLRGAIDNLGSRGCEFEILRVADSGVAFDPPGGGGWDAVVTDPPYGRASGSSGEPASELVARCLPAWADRVRPGGRVVVVLPGGPDPLGPPWTRVVSVPDRVHRSLTREFRVYERVEGRVHDAPPT
jgi:putative methyltransferase (TIGR01177 family)